MQFRFGVLDLLIGLEFAVGCVWPSEGGWFAKGSREETRGSRKMALSWSSVAKCQTAERLPSIQPQSCRRPAVSVSFVARSPAHSVAAATSFKHPRLHCRASADSSSATAPVIKSKEPEEDVPKPIVLIDQDSDPDATVVKLSFGDRLGALLDTTKALSDLGLNVIKGTVTQPGSSEPHEFVITRADTGRKVENPELLEAIRLTIINNLLKYHPESSEQLAMGEAFGVKPPPKKPDVNILTRISIKKDGPDRSLLTIETADRPGLLMEIVKVLTDISVAVESAEIDTEGLVAKDKFHVSYRGAALSKSLEEVLTNALRYFLRRPQTDEDSY